MLNQKKLKQKLHNQKLIQPFWLRNLTLPPQRKMLPSMKLIDVKRSWIWLKDQLVLCLLRKVVGVITLRVWDQKSTILQVMFCWLLVLFHTQGLLQRLLENTLCNKSFIHSFIKDRFQNRIILILYNCWSMMPQKLNGIIRVFQVIVCLLKMESF